MKKFFTLCLMFLVAGVLNLSAGYVLSGENVNGESWNLSSAKNTFTEDENGDLVLMAMMCHWMLPTSCGTLIQAT